MTGSAFLAILGVALGFSAGFAAGSIWTGVASHRRRARNVWENFDPAREADEISRWLKAADAKPVNSTPTQSETDNDHRPR